MKYDRYSDEDLVEIYTTTLDYQGKIETEIGSEIEKRGGIQKLKGSLGIHKRHPHELLKINKEIMAMLKMNVSADEVRNKIVSNVLSKEELALVIEDQIQEALFTIKDSAITSRTIIGSLMGLLISTGIGAAIW